MAVALAAVPVAQAVPVAEWLSDSRWVLGAICGSARSMDRPAQSIWINSLRRNPWMFAQSLDFA